MLLAIGSLGGGGSERQIIHLLQHLDRQRFAPMLYLLNRAGPLLPEVPDDVRVHVFAEQGQPPRVNWPGRIHGRQVADFARVIHQWKVDCVYDRTFHMTLIAGPGARGVPRISSVVSDPDRDLFEQERRFVRLKRRLLRKAYHSATRVVAVSQGVKEALCRDYGLPESRVETIYSPLDLERIDRLAAQPPNAPWPADRFHIVAAGRLLEAKGFTDLIEAAERLVHGERRSQLLFHILGEGPLRARLEADIDKLNLGRHVRLEGFQANPYAFFQRADIVCHPSRYEGLPNVVLEAMACQTPVVACDCTSGPAEILGDGDWGVLAPVEDPSGLAAALARVVDSYDSARGWVDAARQRVEDDFGPETRRAAYRGIDHCCGGAPVRRHWPQMKHGSAQIAHMLLQRLRRSYSAPNFFALTLWHNDPCVRTLIPER